MENIIHCNEYVIILTNLKPKHDLKSNNNKPLQITNKTHMVFQPTTSRSNRQYRQGRKLIGIAR